MLDSYTIYDSNNIVIMQDVNNFLPPAGETENAVAQPDVADNSVHVKTTQTVSMNIAIARISLAS